MPRAIRHRYLDPLDLVWLACAQEVGLEVARDPEVYAAYDGRGTLTLTTREHFDPDDSLAQLLFHELCHALVAGPGALSQPDWGLHNTDDRDLVMEHACHRLQAALAERFGLRSFFAVTTDHRSYWDALPQDPLAPGDDPAIAVARDALELALHGAWSAPLGRALERTSRLAEQMRELPLPADSLWRQSAPMHPAGHPRGGAERCGDCAFALPRGRRLRCFQALWGRAGRMVTVAAEEGSCVRFRPRFGPEICATCGACCREGFDRVEVGPRDPVRKKHPGLLVHDGFGWHVPRPDGCCAALASPGPEGYRCRIYADRPRSCADFAVGGEACLTARRRLGL